jgi:hypothetical protein
VAISGRCSPRTPRPRRRRSRVPSGPDGVRFDGHRDVQVLGAEYLGMLTEGDRLENDDLNPIVYAR